MIARQLGGCSTRAAAIEAVIAGGSWGRGESAQRQRQRGCYSVGAVSADPAAENRVLGQCRRRGARVVKNCVVVVAERVCDVCGCVVVCESWDGPVRLEEMQRR